MQEPKHAANPLARRWFLQQCGIGLGAVALRQMLQASDPLAPKKPHHESTAKNVIFLFMGGGPSHLELFDHKPELGKHEGTLPPKSLLEGYRAAFIDPNSTLLGPKFEFSRHGESGVELSELIPHTASIVDDISIVKSMVTDAFNHAPAQVMMSTGTQQFGRPSMGAWTLYGLGSESRTCPDSWFSVPARRARAAATPIGAAASYHRCTKECSFVRAAIPSCTCPIPPASTASCRGTLSTQSGALTACGSKKLATRKSRRASTPSRWRTGCSRARLN